MISKIQPTMFKTNKRLAIIACSAAIAASVQSIPSWAQSELALEEVIVTARKRDENLMDIPESVTAISGMEIPNYSTKKK